jgi:hypothetical protein
MHIKRLKNEEEGEYALLKKEINFSKKSISFN